MKTTKIADVQEIDLYNLQTVKESMQLSKIFHPKRKPVVAFFCKL